MPLPRKKNMNTFDLLCLERELQVLVDGNFDKAYQPSRDEVLLRFRASGEGRIDVAVGLGDYVLVTGYSRDNPMQPPQFSKQLRKFLTGGKVLDVHQHDFDRVLVFEIGKSDGVYQLVVEVFHKGNVVLVKDDEIVQPLIHTEWSSRVIRPGRDWAFPPMQFNPKQATEPEFIQRMRESDTDLIRTLSSLCNLGPLYAEEVCLRAGLDKEMAIQDASPDELARLANTTRSLIREVREQPNPVLYRDEEGEPVNAAPVPLKVFGDAEHEEVETLSEALDQLFGPGRGPEQEIQDARLQRLDEHKGRLQRQVEDISERLERFQEEELAERKAGDLLYAHFNDVEELLTTCKQMHEEGGWGALFEDTPEAERVRIARLSPEDGTIVLALPDAEGQEHQVKVSLKKSLGGNAEVHYERSKEVREKQEGAKKALAHAKAELQELEERGEEILDELEKEASAPEPTHRFWFDKFRWFLTSTDNLVVAGRDARSNEKVVKKHLEEHDRYIHADLSGAPSVVVKAKDGQVSEKALEEAAAFAIAYSKAWSHQVGSGQAYWVTPPQVSQTPQTGEYVPRGSFIIRGERTYIQAPVKAAIGETHVEGQRKVMGGPVEAIEDRCDRYVVLEPGQVNPGQLASALSEVFDVPVEEIQAVLPPGPARVVESFGIDERLVEDL